MTEKFVESDRPYRKPLIYSISLCSALFLTMCSPSDELVDGKLFEAVPENLSGVSFRNLLHENDSVNYFKYIYIYMGGGVAIGDVNNDGLQDIYFTGNMVENKLYLNKGGMRFEDITEHARVGGDNRWVTGVTMGDVNQDGWLDLYVSVSGRWTTTKNLLFINDANKSGIPTFTESAEQYGVADTGNSTQAVFLDYDLDGDMDLYVINYPLTRARQNMAKFLNYRNNVPHKESDRLYRNDGQIFTDVTKEARLSKYGLSLGVSVGDFNQDGWPDIYVSNDFVTPDYFLINNKDGTFTDHNLDLTRHTSYFGMGTDAADFNNDGLLDIFQADMLPQDNRRSKENMDSMDPERFHKIVRNNMHHQYSVNTLQLNMGIGDDGLPYFSDIARMAKVSSTDWSWAPLFADFDNDGLKDLVVTNGIRRDINNKDFFKREEFKSPDSIDWAALNEKMPYEKISNYAFRNKGELLFEDVTQDWGLYYEGFSNGMAYGDLDNDGDLDLVINDLDGVSKIFKNTSADRKKNNFIRVKLEGPKGNLLGIGSKVWVKTKEKEQFQELVLSRGFQSSVEPFIHFGLGRESEIEEVRIEWFNGKKQLITNPKVNGLITITYAGNTTADFETKKHKPVFEDITKQVGLNHKHVENQHDDYYYQVLLPHNISEYGPAMAVGDVNNDGLDDFYVGGSYRISGELFIQQSDGSFQKQGAGPWKEDSRQEDVGATFFDANNDGLTDLYVVSGGNEFRAGDPYYQDRLYINKGNVQFIKATEGLPDMLESGSCVTAGDYDNDGDEDLFIGSRIVPRSYPHSPKSTILKNESSPTSIKFIDVTAEIAPMLNDIGMVTKARWIDPDKDDYPDLIIIGEWMPITYLQNKNGEFIDRSVDSGFGDTRAWWYGMMGEDFDNDGDEDFVFGNLGLNYKYQARKGEPFTLYTYDYDGNKKEDLVLSYYQQGKQFPVRGRECSSQQVPAIKVKFKDYSSFASATLQEIYSIRHLEQSTKYQVESFASCYAENNGNGTFHLKKLPPLAQISSLNEFVSGDFNGDGHLDFITGGNLYGSEVETPRNDAGYGVLITGEGNGEFRAVMPYDSGLRLSGEVKSMQKLRLAGGGIGILIAKNNDYLQLIKLRNR